MQLAAIAVTAFLLAAPAVAHAAAAAAAAPAARPKITGVAHAAYFVKDIAKSREFYKDLLGYEEPYDIKNKDGSLALTFIKINDRQYIELFPETAASTDRLNHISLETDNAEQMRRYLASKGVKVPGKVNKVRIGNLAFNVTDPEGHTVEFVQYTPAGLTMQMKGKHIGPNRISARMLHTGIIVGPTQQELDFYVGLLGFEVFWRGGRDPKALSWINLRVPNGTDYIEFMLYKDKPAPAERGTQHHVCLEVPDLAKAVADLESRPARKNYTQTLEIRTGVNRRRQCNLFDPDGTRIELMEPVTIDGQAPPWNAAPPPIP
jgi:lactoylglutathione lyase